MQPYNTYKPSGIDWISEIPEHWEIKKLKYVATTKARLGWKGLKAEEYTETGYGFLATPNIKGGEIDYVKINFINEFRYYESPEIMLKEGDVLLAKDGSTLGTVNVIKHLPFPSTVNSSIAILRIVETQCLAPEFLRYFIASDFQQNVIERIKDGMGVPHLFQEDIRNFDTILPPFSEQAAIASYLDDKTAQLDTLIDRKRRLIDLLREEKTALINEAVTKGINPDVPMKDSGIEWLGDIPAHWTLTKIGYLSTVVRGASPRPAGDPKYFNGDHTPWITVAEVTKDEDKYITSVTDYLTEAGAEQSRFIEVGTLLLSNSGATLGVPKILKIGGCINDGSVAFLKLSDKVTIDFVYYFFKSLTYTYREMMKGSGQPNLNTDIVKSTAFGLPLLEEQLKIAQHIDTETAKVDHAITRIEREIELMQEYRTAMISEVVTGKVKVV